MKKIILIAAFCTAIVSCKKDDNAPGPVGTSTGTSIGPHYSDCDSATNTRLNLDTGKPCKCVL